MHLLAGLGLMLARVPPTKAASAPRPQGHVASGARQRDPSILCQHHDLIAKMGAAKVRPTTARRSTTREHGGHGSVVCTVCTVVGMVSTPRVHTVRQR